MPMRSLIIVYRVIIKVDQKCIPGVTFKKKCYKNAFKIYYNQYVKRIFE